MKYKVGDRVIYKGVSHIIIHTFPQRSGKLAYRVAKSKTGLYDFLESSPAVRKETKLDRLLLGLDKSDNAVYNKPEVTND